MISVKVVWFVLEVDHFCYLLTLSEYLSKLYLDLFQATVLSAGSSSHLTDETINRKFVSNFNI